MPINSHHLLLIHAIYYAFKSFLSIYGICRKFHPHHQFTLFAVNLFSPSIPNTLFLVNIILSVNIHLIFRQLPNLCQYNPHRQSSIVAVNFSPTVN